MKIVWDEPKRQVTLERRRLDFASLTPGLFAAALIRPAKKGRLIALGWLDGRPVAAVVQPLGSEGLSVVTLRAASAKERRLL